MSIYPKWVWVHFRWFFVFVFSFRLRLLSLLVEAAYERKLEIRRTRILDDVIDAALPLYVWLCGCVQRVRVRLLCVHCIQISSFAVIAERVRSSQILWNVLRFFFCVFVAVCCSRSLFVLRPLALAMTQKKKIKAPMSLVELEVELETQVKRMHWAMHTHRNGKNISNLMLADRVWCLCALCIVLQTAYHSIRIYWLHRILHCILPCISIDMQIEHLASRLNRYYLVQ